MLVVGGSAHDGVVSRLQALFVFLVFLEALVETEPGLAVCSLTRTYFEGVKAASLEVELVHGAGAVCDRIQLGIRAVRDGDLCWDGSFGVELAKRRQLLPGRLHLRGRCSQRLPNWPKLAELRIVCMENGMVALQRLEGCEGGLDGATLTDAGILETHLMGEMIVDQV